MDKLQKLKREQGVLTHQLDTLNGRLQAGDRTVRAQISAVNRQLTTIKEQIEALTGEKAQEQ